MKFNIKKIASVLATTVMLGSTVAFAAAAYPAPFVNSGVADAAIVYGASAPATGGDMAAATDLGASLEKSVTAVSNAAPTGEAKAVETSGQKLYLGDSMNTTKETFTKTELPTILADGKITDADGASFDYSQKILTPNTAVKYGKTSDNLAEPILYMDFETAVQNYTAQIIFPTAINTTKLTDKDITLFGKKFTFSGSASDLTTTKVVLFENANSKVINSGETVSVNIGGTDYAIAVTAVEDADTALITVNGVSQKIIEGTSYKVNGLDLYAKNVIGPNVAGETRAVELYLGSSKMTLENGNNVVKGSTSVYGTTVYIATSGGKVSKISVMVDPYSLDNRVKYLKMGDSMTDPVFGAFKISLNTVTPALDDTSKDQIVIKSSGEQKASMSWTNKVGGVYNMDMFRPSGLNITGASAYNITRLGYDTYDMETRPTDSTGAVNATINENDYFLTTNGQYSQIWRVDRIDIVNKKIKVRDQAAGSTPQEMSLTDGANGSTATLSLADGSTATLTLFTNASGSEAITASKAAPILYTKSGALINLTAFQTGNEWMNTTDIAGTVTIKEETAYNDGDFKKNTAASLGSMINVSILYNAAGKTGNDMFINAVAAGDSYSGTVGDYDVYYLTKYGTFVKKTGSDDKTVTIYYPGTAASIGAYISEQTSATSGAAGSIPVVKDTDVNSVKDKNLIVVGGSCINTVAASLLGSNTPLCGSAFTAASGVGVDKYLIKVYPASTLFASSGKVAMLVAGYEAKDTAAAVAKIKEGTTDTTVGASVIGPVAG